MFAASNLSTYGEVPGGPGRWTLLDVHTGLDSMAAVYASVNTMADQITLYTTLQGITLQLLIIRLIRILSAQKRLSILTSTAIKVRLAVWCSIQWLFYCLPYRGHIASLAVFFFFWHHQSGHLQSAV